MEKLIELIKQEDADGWETLMFLYNAALKEINTKIDILNDEFQHIYHYTPIEHIKSRIKTPASIVNKLKKNGYETSVENMVKYVNDIAGIRIICSFTSDIYLIADMITKQRFKGSFCEGLHYASKSKRISKLSHSGDSSYSSDTGNCGYHCGNTNPHHCTGFLGKSGT